MRVRILRTLFLVIGLLGAGSSAARTVERVRVGTWNVENLFDAEDNPATFGDDEFLPTSWRRWTEARYRRKLANLAHVIGAMGADILSVQEVENRRVLEDLADLLRQDPHRLDYPHIVHQDSGDSRSIDVGIFSRFPVVSWSLREDIPGMRGALVATVDLDGAELTVIACHWKSWVGEAEANVVTRLRESLAVRAEVERLQLETPDLALVIAGDFNDNLDGHSLQQGLAAYADRDRVARNADGRLLYNVLGDLPEEQLGSYYFARRKVWNTFDALIVTAGMLRPAGEPGPAWRLPAPGDSAVAVFKLPEMLEADGRPKPFRRVRLKDGTDFYAEGYSDHLPVVMELVRAQP